MYFSTVYFTMNKRKASRNSGRVAKLGPNAKRFDNGDIYDGEIQDELRHGKGVMIYADGSNYNGEWTNDLRHGLGSFTADDSAENYEGSWENDKYNGHGERSMKIKKSNSSSRESEWYSGQWKEGKMVRHMKILMMILTVLLSQDGQGKLIYNLGKDSQQTYEGGFQNGVRHGQGVFKWGPQEYSQEYSGGWENDERFGEGTMKNDSGQIRLSVGQLCRS